MLDIGDDVGALVVYLDAIPSTGELELCPSDDPAGHFHTGVHERPSHAGGVAVAVFPGVRQGSYDVLRTNGQRWRRVEIAGGQVRELDLRSV